MRNRCSLLVDAFKLAKVSLFLTWALVIFYQ
jgi:hypothetical protein